MSARLTNLGWYMRLTSLVIWAAVILSAIAVYVAVPEKFTPANIAAFITAFQAEIWLVYFAVSVMRGFTLLPSTPLVLAGTFLYPDQPWLVLFISMAGILISSSLIYFFSEALGFADYFESKKPRTLHRIRRRLEHPAGLFFVAAWAFFPLVPTDAVCYVAGTAKMNFFKFITAVFVGELTLCSIYVITGGSLVRSLI